MNDTMMEQTMHLHGMWMYLENGAGEYIPRKHTVLVKPAEHPLLHIEVGMFRVVDVSDRLLDARS